MLALGHIAFFLYNASMAINNNELANLMQNILNYITKYSIYVLVFLLPLFWLPFSLEMFEFNKQYLLFFLVSLGFFAWLLKMVVYDKEIKFKNSPINYLVLAFLVVSLFSAVFSADKNSSVFGFYGKFSDGLIGLLSFVVFYFLITNTVESKPSSDEEKPKAKNSVSRVLKPLTIDKILNLLLTSAGAVTAIAYFSIFGVWAKISSFLPLPQVMLQKTFNPVAGSLEGLAVFLAVIVALLTGLLAHKTRSIFYWLLLFASSGLLAIIDFTPAWIILLATFAVFTGASLVKRIFRENVNRLLMPIVLIIISLAFIIWQPLKMNLPKEQVLPQPTSWQVAAESATDNVKNIFLGSGPGTFHYDFAKYKPLSFNQNWMWQIRFDRAGSYFAELLATTGFLGLLAYLGIAGLFLFIAWFCLSKDFIGFPMIITFIAPIARRIVYYPSAPLSFIFWLILGLSAVSWLAMPASLMQEKKISFKNFPELSLIFMTATVVFGVAILSVYFYGIKYYLADLNYYNALLTLGDSRVNGLEKAVNLNPSFSIYRTALARAYLIEAVNETQKPAAERDAAKIQLLVARSIDQAGTATRLQPNQVSSWETLGVIYREIKDMAAGATDWGIKSFKKAIELEPTNPVLYTELGRLYLVSGDKEKAKDSFNEALEKKSDYVTATIQLALLLEQDNILDEATAKLENAVQVNPYNVDARFQLGRLYFNNGKIDEAIGQFQSAIILVPNYSNAHYSLGVAYAAKGEKELAVQEFEKVLELNPGNADVLQKLKELGR